MSPDKEKTSGQDIPPNFAQLLKTFARVGLLSFGGPTAQIALIHQEIVNKKNWLSEDQFLGALSFCMLLPGPEAMQLATYSGWRLHGVKGGLAAGILFILPGSILVLILAGVYASYGDIPLINSIFTGIKATVIVIVIDALIRISKKALKRKSYQIIAILSFISFFFLSLPFPVVIFAAGVIGFVIAWVSQKGTATPPKLAQSITKVKISHTLFTILIWLTIWLVPVIIIFFLLGSDHVVVQLGIFFSKLAVVTFGGAYSVLAYMAQEVVQNHGWLNPQEMLDGLGLAETTNGPLILVTEFVGYIAAYRFEESYSILHGIAGALMTLWVTFLPCFLWIFTGAPYIEYLQTLPRLQGALSGITAAVVGVILNLTIWFSFHVFFETVTKVEVSPFLFWIPTIGSIDMTSVTLSVIASIALLKMRFKLPWVLFLTGGLAVALHLVLEQINI